MCSRRWPLQLETLRERTQGGVNLGCTGRDSALCGWVVGPCCARLAQPCFWHFVCHRWQPTRPRSPWGSLGKNTGVGCHSLLQGIFPTQELNWGLLHCRWILYPLSHRGRPQTTSTPLYAGGELQGSNRDRPPTHSERNLDLCSPGLPRPGCAPGAFPAAVAISESMGTLPTGMSWARVQFF